MFSWEWGVMRVVLELVPTLKWGGGLMFGGEISQGVAGYLGYGLPEQTHASELGCVGQLPCHELMSIYFNDRPNGF